MNDNSADLKSRTRKIIESIKKQTEVRGLSTSTFEMLVDFGAIGQVAVYFNLLDQSLLYLTIDLLGFRDPAIGMELVKTWTVDQKLDAIRKVMERYRSMTVFDDEDVRATLALFGDIKEISRERNKLMHGFASYSELGSLSLKHPKWEGTLALDSTEIAPLISRILSASKKLGDLAKLADERLDVLKDAIRRFEIEDANPGAPY